MAFGYGLFLWLWYRHLIRDRAVRRLVRRRIACWMFIPIVFNNFELALFSLSARYVDISIVAVVYELYHIGVIWLTAYLFRRERRYRPVTITTLLLMSVGLAGIGFVVFAQTGMFWGLDENSAWSIGRGLGLAVAATVAAACAAYAFRWSVDVGRDMVDRGLAPDDGRADVFCVVAVNLIANAICVPLNLMIGFSFNEDANTSVLLGTVGVAVLGGLFLNSVPSVFWRKANLETRNLGINALGYATPLFSLLWLWCFAFVGVASWQYLVVGTAAVITVNLLVNFEAERRFGFSGLLVALWLCGAFVYVREEIFPRVGVDQWVWTSAGYIETITLSATVFTLLLAFRVARLVTRINSEVNQTFVVYRSIQQLVERNVLSGEILTHVMRIDCSRDDDELQVAYELAMDCLAGVCPLRDADVQMLVSARSELDMLVRSKGQGIGLGELFALVAFAGITVVFGLFSRLDVGGWQRVLVDMFAILLSTVVIFLTVNVWDLQRERGEPKLAFRDEHDGHAVRFFDSGRRRTDVLISVLMGSGIVLTFFVLLTERWVG